MAYALDVFLLLLLVSSPALPFVARIGPGSRIISGSVAILLGVFLAIAFWFTALINWQAHWLLGNVLELLSLALLPLSLVLFIVGPFLYVILGCSILSKKRG